MTEEIAYENVKTGRSEEKLELLVGERVMLLLEESSFLEEWHSLYHSCHWATVFQSPEFVTTWYKLYQNKYLPILIVEQKKGQLTGLFTLALPYQKSNTRDFIVGAGHHEADYQTWLATDSNGNSFVSLALGMLMRKYPTIDIMLRHLPPNTPTDWAKSEPRWQGSSILYPLTRPLVVMSDFTISKRDRKRVNQLKRICEFTQITNEVDFNDALDDLSVYYDFRQGAMFNKNPFRDDPLTKEFLLALFRCNLLHVTVLKTENQTVACVAALTSKNKANLGGINFHSPLFAKYSPGYVHFLMLSQQFAQEGLSSFDLTPGGDAYKDRLATQHDQVYILVVTNSRFYALKRKLRKTLYQRLTRMGIRTMSVELSLKRQLYLVKERGLAFEIARRIKKLRSNNKKINYHCTVDPLNYNGFPVNHNCLRDLLDYQMQGSLCTRWEFLESAMRKLEQGLQSYTFSDQGSLLFCAWYDKSFSENSEALSALGSQFIYIQDFYMHPSSVAQLREFLTAVVAEIGSSQTNTQVYLPIPDHDQPLLMTMNRARLQLIK